MPKQPIKQTIALVVVGSMNPVIITPDWLEKKRIISEKERENCKISVIHPELTQFSVGWAVIRIEPTRFQIDCDSLSYFEPAKDMLVSIFSILRETPVTALGINHALVFRTDGKQQYKEFGNFLVPLSRWEAEMTQPGVMSIEILDTPRKDGYKGYRRVRVEAANEVGTGSYNVAFNINDHYDFENGATNLLDICNNNWELSFKKARSITDSIWTQFSKI